MTTTYYAADEPFSHVCHFHIFWKLTLIIVQWWSVSTQIQVCQNCAFLGNLNGSIAMAHVQSATKHIK